MSVTVSSTSSPWSYRLVFSLCIVWPLLAMWHALSVRGGGELGDVLQQTLPQRVHEVVYRMELRDGGAGGNFRTYLPVGDSRQEVLEEGVLLGQGVDAVTRDVHGRKASWRNVSGPVQYRTVVRTRAAAWDLIEAAEAPTGRPAPRLEPFLESTEVIQSDHPDIAALARRLELEGCGPVEALRRIYESVLALESAAFKGTTDALTALRLGEASCNGKSRLFVALCRHIGLPTRLVGGVILETGDKRTSHQWVEVNLQGQWVPFDALNGHFAALPADYLTLYHGDVGLFGHSAGIPLDYGFSIRPQLRLPRKALREHAVWRAFADAGLPSGALGFLLLLPLGAAVVAFMRNVVGLRTFGLFLPALIAVSMKGTGLGIGTMAFLLVLFTVAAVHPVLMRWRLLYTPRLVILLVAVVGCYLAVSAWGWRFGQIDWVRVTLFPVVVVAITAERFAREIEEIGWREALSKAVQTLVVVVLAYFAMRSTTAEAMLLAFPELFLWIVAAMMALGRWTGIRVVEFFRFRFVSPPDSQTR